MAITAWSAKARDKLDFLLRKRPHCRPRQSNDANRVSLSQERHTKHSAKGVKLDKFGHSVFRIALSVWNVNYLALKHGSSGQRSPIDRNGMLLEILFELVGATVISCEIKSPAIAPEEQGVIR